MKAIVSNRSFGRIVYRLAELLLGFTMCNTTTSSERN